LLSFSFSLLIGIILTAIVGVSGHGHVNMTVAYRRIALPSALVGGFVVLCLSLVMEIRHYRQSKTLFAIERMT
jgi:Na+/glutamate symporter